VTNLDRLNEFTAAAVLGGEPDGLTEDEREDWEAIRDEVRAEPDVVWCPVFDS
jgi:hypothetical protein